ncbi:MAG TPA: response regulator [Candidatus Mediterraneibacter merdipullorum]|nr:response regulator [Candidatus Mediterraneibacter merdipullorum]
MINIVLVDDDALALTKMKDLIHIKGAKVAAEFTQADQALEYIRDSQPDILITDMRMPRIDGVELIRLAKQFRPDLQVIAISSYKDFHYVKESFREGSIDYILKHMMTEENMTGALLEAMKQVRKNKEEMPQEEMIEEGQTVLREKIFSQMFRDEISVEKAEEDLKKYRISLDVSSTVIMMCEIDGYGDLSERFQEEDRRIFLNAARNIIEKVTEKVPDRVIIKISEERYVVLLSFSNVKSQLYIYSSSAQYARQLNTNMKKLMNVDLSISLGRLCMSLKELRKSYGECEALLKNKFFEGKGKIYNHYTAAETAGIHESHGKAGKFQGSRVYQKLLSRDESCMDDIRNVFRVFKEEKVPAMVIELGVVEMLNAGYKVIEEKNLEEIREKENFHVLYGKIKRQDTADEMSSEICRFYQDIIDELKKQEELESSGYSKYTSQAVSYLNTNYRTAVSLRELAEQMGIHYAYLSKVFKHDTGVNFGEYLNNIRIEKAKEMIREGRYRIKEISAEVGFNQYNYFFKVFKQVEGCTPTEFEKKIKNV